MSRIGKGSSSSRTHSARSCFLPSPRATAKQAIVHPRLVSPIQPRPSSLRSEARERRRSIWMGIDGNGARLEGAQEDWLASTRLTARAIIRSVGLREPKGKTGRGQGPQTPTALITARQPPSDRIVLKHPPPPTWKDAPAQPFFRRRSAPACCSSPIPPPSSPIISIDYRPSHPAASLPSSIPSNFGGVWCLVSASLDEASLRLDHRSRGRKTGTPIELLLASLRLPESTPKVWSIPRCW